MKLFYSFVSCIMLLTFHHALTAQVVLRGQVADDLTGEALVGASVIVKGTTNGAITDYDGNFEIRNVATLPTNLVVNYIGYVEKEIMVQKANERINVRLNENALIIETVEIKGQRISDKQKEAPLTVEAMDLLAIKSTPAISFYEGLGSLKGVDLTTASLGFTVINTRGFNSTSPVRSLQIIDGVDNQSPGLNFSLGNFLGASELDVQKVELTVGASSAFFGPNAFNGVIDIRTKDPFIHKGLATSLKVGERSLFEGALRYADAVKNKDGNDFFAYKVNFLYMRAYDWEADNYDPVFGTKDGRSNPGGYDKVNVYGDEYSTANDYSTSSQTQPWTYPGLGTFYRSGYREVDLVDYNMRNYKAGAAFHFRTRPSRKDESPEIILSSNFGSGTTVYQGDNRFSLRNILFFQHRAEFRKKDNYFIRAYVTHEDAGDSYDPYFTALRMQDSAKQNKIWAADYDRYWRANISNRVQELGFPAPPTVIGIDPVTGALIFSTFDYAGADSWLANNQDSLRAWHAQAQAFANAKNPQLTNTFDFYQPGTTAFDNVFNSIVKRKRKDGGTRFVDKSALYHLHGEKKFFVKNLNYLTVGANARLYTPNSEGTIFSDDSTRITNFEYGMYAGAEKGFNNNKVRLSATVRMDKNQNFDFLVSPAASLVWTPREQDFFRLSFSSAIRNPTLTDQYLNLDVGRATLRGNLNGVDSLITVGSFGDYLANLDQAKLKYFNIAPIRPEKVKTFEVGYRTTLFDRLYVDAGYYFSFYNDFIGYNIGVDASFDPFSGFPTGVQAYRYAANSTKQVTTQGLSVGLNYYFQKYYMLSGNYSFNRLNSDTEDDPIIPAFNTPENKFNLGLSGRDMEVKLGNRTVRNLGFTINYKWIQGFIFEGSPQFTGAIPTYDLLDAQINQYVPKWNMTFKIGASNVLNKKQFQTYGGPRVGRLAYISAVYEFKKKF